MTAPLADAVMRDYLSSNPDARAARLNDATFAAEVTRLELVLGRLDGLLVAEGLDDEARHRVGKGLVEGLLLPDDARARIEEQQRTARALFGGRVSFPV